MRSMGDTTKTASVVPAARPANTNGLVNTMYDVERERESIKSLPKKTPVLEVLPSASANKDLYNSKELKRMAILGTIPAMTAPRPLYRAQNDSFFTIRMPTPKKPRRLPCIFVSDQGWGLNKQRERNRDIYRSVSLGVLCELHSDFDSIERMAGTRFHETCSTTSDQVGQERCLFTVVVSAHDTIT